MADRTALVTGGMGFVGHHVTSALISQGYRVVGVGHGSAPLPESTQNFRWIEGDIKLEVLNAINEPPDLIFHCAGGGSVAFANNAPFVDYSRTVETTLAVLEYARISPAKPRVVLPSSAAVYGDASIFPTPESQLTAPVSPYGVHKEIAEKICQSYARHYSVSVAIVRLFSVYGVGLKKQLLWDACRKLSEGNTAFFGTGEEVRDWIHVSDAVALMIRAADFAGESCPIYNGGGGEAFSNRVLLEFLAERLGVIQKPCFSGQTKAGDPLKYCADIDKSRAINWTPKVSWKDGVSEYAEWFQRTV